MTSYLNALTRVLGSDSGSLDVVLDEKGEVTRAGRELCGKVLLKVDKESTGGKVEVEVIGREQSIRKRGPVDMCKEHVFFSVTHPVRDLTKTKLLPGEMPLSFSIDLPHSLPSSSMHKLGVGDVGFKIEYKLTARMGSCSKSIPVGIAAAALEGPKAPFIMQPTVQPIISMKGSSQGSLTFAASVQNTHIRKGDEIYLSLSCRNDSLVTIQRVEAKVVELLNWGLKEGYSKTRANKITLASFDNLDLPGIQRDNDNKSKLVDANYPTMEDQNAKYSTMHSDLLSGNNTVQLECPPRSRDSYAGTLVDVRHYIKIKFITNSFGSQPSIRIPLKIGLPNEIPRVCVALDAGSSKLIGEVRIS